MNKIIPKDNAKLLEFTKILDELAKGQVVVFTYANTFNPIPNSRLELGESYVSETSLLHMTCF